jgi:hypothetical protein
MPTSSTSPTASDRDESNAWAEAFIAGFRSPDTRRAYRRDGTAGSPTASTRTSPRTGVARRTHIEAYLRQLEQHRPPLASVIDLTGRKTRNRPRQRMPAGLSSRRTARCGAAAP